MFAARIKFQLEEKRRERLVSCIYLEPANHIRFCPSGCGRIKSNIFTGLVRLSAGNPEKQILSRLWNFDLPQSVLLYMQLIINKGRSAHPIGKIRSITDLCIIFIHVP